MKLVVAAFLLEDGRVLLVRQKNRQFWTPPGGFLEKGEDPMICCVREIKEEVGLDVRIYGHLLPTVVWKPKNKENLTFLNFLARRERSQPIDLWGETNLADDGQVLEARWVKFAQLKFLALGPNVLPTIDWLERQTQGLTVGRLPKVVVSKSRKDQEYIKLAIKQAEKSGCLFRKVGGMMVKGGRVILKSYNQVLPTQDFCQKNGCIRQKLGVLPGQRLEVCNVIHAEANLLAQATQKGVNLKGATVFLTSFPCSICAKLLACSGIKRLVFAGDYSNDEGLWYFENKKIKVFRVKEK